MPSGGELVRHDAAHLRWTLWEKDRDLHVDGRRVRWEWEFVEHGG
ncbi:hypothetical protein GCM10027406_35440 [Leifsonia lichenia]